MTTSSTRQTCTDILHETEVDGGWSGRLRVVVGNNGKGAHDLVLVDSDLLCPRRLVLAVDHATKKRRAVMSDPPRRDVRPFGSQSQADHACPEVKPTPWTPPLSRSSRFSPAIAEDWLARNSYARDLGAGRFALDGETVKFSAEGQLYDGQHRLNAVVQSWHRG